MGIWVPCLAKEILFLSYTLNWSIFLLHEVIGADTGAGGAHAAEESTCPRPNLTYTHKHPATHWSPGVARKILAAPPIRLCPRHARCKPPRDPLWTKEDQPLIQGKQHSWVEITHHHQSQWVPIPIGRQERRVHGLCLPKPHCMWSYLVECEW